MPVTYVYTENTIAEWRTLTNILGTNIGDLDNLELPYPANADLVSAINALYSGAVSLEGLYTTETNTVIGAMNELWSNIGPLPGLQTNLKSNIVFAINELWGNIGPLPNLLTANKGNIVSAINEIYAEVFSGTGALEVSNIAVAGDSNLYGNVRIGGWLYVDKNALFNGTVVFNRETNFLDNVNVTSDIFRVNSEYIFLNSNNIYMMDPVLHVGTTEDGGDYPSNDAKDRGIKFGYFRDTLPRYGFFGFDGYTDSYYFLTNIVEVEGYVYPGDLANINFNYAFVGGGLVPNIISTGEEFPDIGLPNNRFGNIYAYGEIEASNLVANVYFVSNIILPTTNLFVDIGTIDDVFNTIYANNVVVGGITVGTLEITTVENLVNSIVTTGNIGTSLTDPGGPLDAANIANLLASQGATFNNTTVVLSASNLNIDDSLILLGSNNLTSDTLDIGFYAPYESNSNVFYTGFFRDATDKVYRVVDGITDDPVDNIVSYTEVNLANLQAREFRGNLIGIADAALTVLAGGLTTTNVTEGTNLYFTDSRAQSWFEGNVTFVDPLYYNSSSGDVILNTLYTSNIVESGDTTTGNVYFTNTRARLAVSNTGVGLFYNKIAGIFSLDLGTLALGAGGGGGANGGLVAQITTDDIVEGGNNLYFTNARVQDWFDSNIHFLSPLLYDPATGNVALNALTTDDVPEGNINQYYTDAKARAAISSGDEFIVYNSGTGVITLSAAATPGVTSVNGQTNDVVLGSDDISEGSVNLFFTEGNWNARVATLTTANIAEEPGNLYFTNARVWGSFNPDPSVDIDANTGHIGVNIAGICEIVVLSVNGVSGNVTLNTQVVPEVTNLYFTNARARQSISVSGAVTYDNSTGVITVPGPYGIYFRHFKYTLAASGNVITGPDDDGHTLIIDSPDAIDVFVNGVKAYPGLDFVANNNFASSNVLFTSALPAFTEISVREITGNLAVAAGYVTETRTDYLEPLVSIGFPVFDPTVSLDLGFGTTTNFKVNVYNNIDVTFVNPPVTANKVFVFTMFVVLGPENNGEYIINWPLNVRWDDDSEPILTGIPDRIEAFTFITFDSGVLYYGYKNISAAPSS